MEIQELQSILRAGEDSRHQFKRDITNATSLAGEMVAFANSAGGMIIIGVEDDGQPVGLRSEDIHRLNQLVSNTASSNVKNPIVENISLDGKLLMVVHIPEGVEKPYMDNKGVAWQKSGADKRRITSKEELRRLFQVSDLVNADEVIVKNTSVEDIHTIVFAEFYEKVYGEHIKELDIPIIQLFENLNLAANDRLNLAGLLLFGRNPHKHKPAFIIKAVHFAGNDVEGEIYNDSRDITGTIQRQYEDGLAFIVRNLKNLQNGKPFNSIGDLEIPEIVLQELLVNALIHRDYFINAPIRIFVFDNRVEIISPGRLPNHLTVQHISNGISNIRNATLASFATKTLPYRGIGTGVRRSIKKYPHIQFINDREGEQFTVIIQRPEHGQQ